MNALFEISGLNIYIQIVITIIFILAHLFRTRRQNRQETLIELITLHTIGLAGWFSITSGFFGHIIYADEVATGIGWALNSGFQMELAFASIGIGIVGAIGFRNKSYWLPFIIAKSSFMWGAGFIHILYMVQENNLSPSNTGIVVYWDFLFPILLIVLFTLYKREKNSSQLKVKK